MLEGSTPETIGNRNRIAILQLLKQEKALSRAEISRRLNLSFPAVSSNSKILLDNNFIVASEETEGGNNAIGRPSVVLRYNARRGYVVGVCSDIKYIRAVCADLLGNVIASTKKKFDLTKGGEEMYNLMYNAIQEVIEKGGINPKTLECIAIGIPGVFDEKMGKYRLVPFVENWEDIGIKRRIQERMGTRVIMDNVANLSALGEYCHGISKGYQNSVFIDYTFCIGAGIIINGELYNGCNNAAGEIGYLMLDRYYLRHSFRDEGALEEMISSVTISDNVDLNNSFEDVSVLIDMADAGDQRASRLIHDLVVYFAMALVNIIAIINPGIVIVSGSNGRVLMEKNGDKINRILKAHIPYMPEIAISQFKDDASIIGAVELALQNVEEDMLAGL